MRLLLDSWCTNLTPGSMQKCLLLLGVFDGFVKFESMVQHECSWGNPLRANAGIA